MRRVWPTYHQISGMKIADFLRQVDPSHPTDSKTLPRLSLCKWHRRTELPVGGQPAHPEGVEEEHHHLLREAAIADDELLPRAGGWFPGEGGYGHRLRPELRERCSKLTRLTRSTLTQYIGIVFRMANLVVFTISTTITDPAMRQRLDSNSPAFPNRHLVHRYEKRLQPTIC